MANSGKGAAKRTSRSAKQDSVTAVQTTASNESNGYRFGGTQTFSLRQLWPYKAFQYSLRRMKNGQSVSLADTKMAIMELGVGSNMVDSIFYWAKCLNILNDKNYITPFALKIFGNKVDSYSDSWMQPSLGLMGLDDDECKDEQQSLAGKLDDVDPLVLNLLKAKVHGLDCYAESISTLWLWHYYLCSEQSNYTVLWFLFNRFNKNSFTKEEFLEDFNRFLEQEVMAGRLKRKPSDKTIKVDLDVAVRTYAPLTRNVGVLRSSVKKLDNVEDISDYPMRELQIMRSTVQKIEFNRGFHSSLNPFVFAYCLLDFFCKHGKGIVTMDFNKIAYEDGSPGRIFKLDEKSLGDYLFELESLTEGALTFSEQNGIRQLTCSVSDQAGRKALQNSLLEKVYSND